MVKLFTPLSNKKLPLVIAILLLLALNPYYTWWLNTSPLYRILLNITIPILFFFSREKKENKTPIALYIIATFLFVFLGLVSGRASIIGSISASICFLYAFVFFANKTLLFDVLEQIINILFILLGLAIISWVFYLTGHNSIMGVIPYPLNPELTYSVYPFFIISNSFFDYDHVLRFAGPFVEPGFLGTLSALILVTKKFNLKDVRLIVVFIAGLFSLSLAFYIIAAFFGLFYLAVEKRKIVPTCILLLLMGVFYSQTKDNEVLSSTIWERIEWDSSSGKMAGDNRSNDKVDAYYERIKGTSEFYIGTKNPNWYQDVAGGASATYKSVICINGFITVALYLLYLLQLGWSNKRNLAGFILFAIVLFLNFYQRSSFYSLPVLFLYCCMAKADMMSKPLKEI